MVFIRTLPSPNKGLHMLFKGFIHHADGSRSHDRMFERRPSCTLLDDDDVIENKLVRRMVGCGQHDNITHNRQCTITYFLGE